MGYKVAGYSVNGDGGSLLGRVATERNYARAKDGDVIISHINQPTHEAGEGVGGTIARDGKGHRGLRLQARRRSVAAGFAQVLRPDHCPRTRCVGSCVLEERCRPR